MSTLVPSTGGEEERGVGSGLWLERAVLQQGMDERFFALFLDSLGGRLEMLRSAQGWLHLEDPQFAEIVERFRRSATGFDTMDEAAREFIAMLFAAAAMAAWDARQGYDE
ncbi:MAG: hypothetical protein HY680_08625 [Chloroflexi bacterium]|nr:hypothetical protein [Chloroflexota bacterium]